MPDTAPVDIDILRLQQERELKEKELALRERELQAQKHSRPTPWSTPAVVAIVGGVLGYMGTLITSCQNRQLEREKHEATLILEAIKTSGTTQEKDKQTAANLVFLADAGLITTIKLADLEKLRTKAQGAGPSLPSVQGVEFQRSSTLTVELQSKLQAALSEYEKFLARIGYDAAAAPGRVTVRIDEQELNNAYFDNESVVIGRNLAVDPEYALSEYTWYVLKQTNPKAFQVILDSPQPNAFTYGLKFYLPSSHLNDPAIGKNYSTLTRLGPPRPHLFSLSEFHRFDKNAPADANEVHLVGEVWGGALWEIRSILGRDVADRLVMSTWKSLNGTASDFSRPSFVINAFVVGARSSGAPNADRVREAFARRGLE